jgi:hypothetical protein
MYKNKTPRVLCNNGFFFYFIYFDFTLFSFAFASCHIIIIVRIKRGGEKKIFIIRVCK